LVPRTEPDSLRKSEPRVIVEHIKKKEDCAGDFVHAHGEGRGHEGGGAKGWGEATLSGWSQTSRIQQVNRSSRLRTPKKKFRGERKRERHVLYESWGKIVKKKENSALDDM